MMRGEIQLNLEKETQIRRIALPVFMWNVPLKRLKNTEFCKQHSLYQ